MSLTAGPASRPSPLWRPGRPSGSRRARQPGLVAGIGLPPSGQNVKEPVMLFAVPAPPGPTGHPSARRRRTPTQRFLFPGRQVTCRRVNDDQLRRCACSMCPYIPSYCVTSPLAPLHKGRGGRRRGGAVPALSTGGGTLVRILVEEVPVLVIQVLLSAGTSNSMPRPGRSRASMKPSLTGVGEALDDVVPPVRTAHGVFEGDVVLGQRRARPGRGRPDRQAVGGAVGAMRMPWRSANSATHFGSARPPTSKGSGRRRAYRVLLDQVLEVLAVVDLLAGVDRRGRALGHLRNADGLTYGV